MNLFWPSGPNRAMSLHRRSCYLDHLALKSNSRLWSGPRLFSRMLQKLQMFRFCQLCIILSYQLYGVSHSGWLYFERVM